MRVGVLGPGTMPVDAGKAKKIYFGGQGMIGKKAWEEARLRTLACFRSARIALTKAEEERIEIADFGLGRLAEIGLEILTYVNTERCCAKELVLFPHQLCPEHRHPPLAGMSGKEETFRCRHGCVYLYVPGERGKSIFGHPPTDKGDCFTVWHEIRLSPGEQYTLLPNTPHWFQAGPEGAIVSEFSTKSVDEADVFTDPEIKRLPVVSE